MKELRILILMCYFERPNMATIALHSVRESTYPNWHLAIVDDGSSVPIAPIARDILSGSMEKITFFQTGDSTEQKSTQGGSRFGAFWNEAIRSIPADVAIMLCDDDALFPHYLANLDRWFRENPDRTYCFSHVWPFNPLTLEDLSDIQPGALYNYTGEIVPQRNVDASQVAWRTRCHEEFGIWFPAPQTSCLDASFFEQLHAHYGPCPFSGFVGQYKGLGHGELGVRQEVYVVRDRERPYCPPVQSRHVAGS